MKDNKEGKMNRNKMKRYLFVVFLIAGLSGFIPRTTALVMGQEEKTQTISPAVGAPAMNGKENDTKPEALTAKNQKQVMVAGVPLGFKRSEITRLFFDKNILPLQRTAPMDIFPRLIGEISHIQKAYLYYTSDRLSKLNIVFNLSIDPKIMTGEPIFDYYEELRKDLIKNFGQPTNTTSHVHPNFPYKLIALETGNAYFFDYWENVNDMKVLLSLKGGEGKIDFTLTYQYLPLFE
jgi:hypothetical protein